MQQIEQNRRATIERFVAACQQDERVVAAFLGGSSVRNATDAYSDIDFGLITTDEASCPSPCPYLHPSTIAIPVQIFCAEYEIVGER